MMSFIIYKALTKKDYQEELWIYNPFRYKKKLA